MTIKEFTDMITQISIDEGKNGLIDWNRVLAEKGYCPVQAGGFSAVGNWRECHAWCKEQFGREHYTWTGSKFWFETEQDAMLFLLKWS